MPLCALQPQTARAEALYKRYEIAVWWATPVEMVSGLTRLRRMGDLGLSQFAAGKQRAEKLSLVWSMIQPVSSIANQACRLLEIYPLRAADALQLAAALEKCGQNPHGRILVTGDQRLAEAARLSGFSVEFL
jgi:predicted nucleic acid-binding protein